MEFVLYEVALSWGKAEKYFRWSELENHGQGQENTNDKVNDDV